MKTTWALGLTFGTATMTPALALGAAPTGVQAVDILATLFLCGFMGLIGQGCRVIVGFATIATSKAVAPAANQDVVNLARLFFSLIIGFVAGVVAALFRWKQASGLGGIAVGDFSDMLSFAIAGYIGTDIIEAFTVQFFELQKKAPKSPEHEPPE